MIVSKKLNKQSRKYAWLFLCSEAVEDMDMNIIKLISEGREDKFYNSRTWRNFRIKILQRDHYECQYCKAKKVRKIVRATHVHHVQELKDRPDLALEPDNLISLCHTCHEEVHDRLAKANEARKKEVKFMNDERW